MVDPADPEAPPRRDGWLERRGTWGEVVIGCHLPDDSRTRVWEVIGGSLGGQAIFGHTPWWRLREISSGEEKSLRPKIRKYRTRFLTRTALEPLPPRTPIEDPAVLAARIEGLDARVNEEAGEIVCPYYMPAGRLDWRDVIAAEVEHLRIFHGVEGAEDPERLHASLHWTRSTTLDHAPNRIPHRHEEDRDQLALIF